VLTPSNPRDLRGPAAGPPAELSSSRTSVRGPAHLGGTGVRAATRSLTAEATSPTSRVRPSMPATGLIRDVDDHCCGFHVVWSDETGYRQLRQERRPLW